MSSVGDAFVALKNVVLLHERLDGVRKEVERLNGDLGGISTFVHSINIRVVRIETMIEMTAPRGTQPPLIEGK